MSGFEFIFGLFSVILSLAITEVLSGAARLVRHGERVRFSLTQSLWMLVFALSAVGNWLSLWQLRDIPSWGALQLLFAVALVAAQFVACALVCPDVPESGVVDMAAFHERERRRYLSAYAALAVIAMVGNLFFAETADIQRWAQENWLNFPDLVAILVALIARDPWLRRVALALDLGLTLFWLGTSSVTLG